MKFSTEVKISEFESKIEYKDNLFFIGSCFSDSIGNKFKDNFFNSMINPFGVLYNPMSIKRNIDNLINSKIYLEKDLFFHNNLWKSFDHHGVFSNQNKNNVLEKININTKNARNYLKTTDFLFITFGTAWVYELKSNNQIVANCHKVLAEKFNRKLLSIDEIVENYNKLIIKLKKFNPEVKIFFTVSPIRHLKDGANGNQISKSILILAIKELTEQNTNIFYFPSYEIVLDELRDYRFYSEDLVHLNNFAINFIWEKINNSFFSEKTKKEVLLVEKLNKKLSHRIMKDNLEEIKKYIKNLDKSINKIEEINTEINLKKAKQKKIELINLLEK